jgi:mRNA interferase RelE/StbE
LSFKVQIQAGAQKVFLDLERDTQKRIIKKLEALAVNPLPSSVVKLQGYEKLYRLRVGDYRVVYELHNDKLLVLVVRIAHRKDVYRDL